MSRITDPYRCDECSTLKQESSKWFLVFPTFELKVERGPLIRAASTGTLVIPWSVDLIDEPGVKHVCGLDCVNKMVMKSISAIA